ncbi:MAG: response regulator transcription factor [Candidatus Limnocylindria bacterium]
MPRRRADPGVGGGTVNSSAEQSAPRTLTDRQLEILVHVARGRTNRQVGQALGISERTVRNHLRTISHKLAASDRTHAVVLAIERGWIAIPIEPDRPVGLEPAVSEAPAEGG